MQPASANGGELVLSSHKDYVSVLTVSGAPFPSFARASPGQAASLKTMALSTDKTVVHVYDEDDLSQAAIDEDDFFIRFSVEFPDTKIPKKDWPLVRFPSRPPPRFLLGLRATSLFSPLRSASSPPPRVLVAMIRTILSLLRWSPSSVTARSTSTGA